MTAKNKTKLTIAIILSFIFTFCRLWLFFVEIGPLTIAFILLSIKLSEKKE